MEDLYGDKLEENYELLAYHYGRSPRDEKAVDYMILAGDKSAKVYSTEDAIGYYEEGLRRLGKMPDTRANKEQRVDIFIKQAKVMRLMGRFKEHIKTLENNLPIVEELGDKEPAQQSSDAGRVGGIGKLTPHKFPEAVQQSHLLKGRHDLRRLAKVKSVFPSLAEIVTVAQGA